MAHEPIESGRQAENSHEGDGGFLAAGGDGAPFLQSSPQALGEVAVVADPGRAGGRRLIAPGRDSRAGAEVAHLPAEGIGGVAAVGNDPGGDGGQGLQQVRGGSISGSGCLTRRRHRGSGLSAFRVRLGARLQDRHRIAMKLH